MLFDQNSDIEFWPKRIDRDTQIDRLTERQTDRQDLML